MIQIFGMPLNSYVVSSALPISKLMYNTEIVTKVFNKFKVCAIEKRLEVSNHSKNKILESS
jgi:hypothetical protein